MEIKLILVLALLSLATCQRTDKENSFTPPNTNETKTFNWLLFTIMMSII